MTALLKSVSDIVEDARADERKKVLATREEEIKQAVKMATLLERQAVIKEIESLLVDEEYPITDQDSIDYGIIVASPKNEWNDELRAKLEKMKGGK